MASPIENHRDHDLLNMVHNKIILKEHNKENLLSLLLLSNPQLTLTDVVDDKHRIQAMQDLMVTIHPSNFSYHEDAQGVFEDVQRFYDLCNKKIMESKESKGRRCGRNRPTSPTSVVDQVVQCKFVSMMKLLICRYKFVVLYSFFWLIFIYCNS